MLKWISVVAFLFLSAGAAVAQDIPDEEYGMGLVEDPPQLYRNFSSVPRYRAFLPPEVDLSSRFPVPGNQGQQGSCTAWATGYALRSYQEGKDRKWESFSSQAQTFSPAYLYNRLHADGNCVGTSISAALDLMKTEGVAPLSEFPYSASDCVRQPDERVKEVAAQFRIKGWRALDVSRLDNAKGRLASGDPVVFGMKISRNFFKLKGSAIYDDLESPRFGSHAMVLVGYSEERQAFKLINSWGTNWGDKGFAWVSYDAVLALSDNQYVVEGLTEPKPVVVVEPPKPVPAPIVVVQPPKPVPAPIVVVQPPKPVPAPIVVVEPPKPVPAPIVVVEPPKPVPAPIVVVQPPKPVPAPIVVVEPPKPVPTPIVVVEPPKPVPAPIVVVEPPKPVPAPIVVVEPPRPPAPGLEQTRTAVESLVKRVGCARIDATLTALRSVKLTGFIGSVDDLNALKVSLAAVPGVNQVDADLKLRPWPQCEVFLNFADTLATPKGLSIHLAGGQGPDFRGGDSLVVEVTTPSYPSYVYVSYLQASGEVVHLAWPQGRFPKPMPPNAKLTFGGGANGQPVYRVGPPFGDEVIVVTTSASPLFQTPLPATDDDRDYLTSFRRAFALRPKGGSGERIVSTVVSTLHTQSKLE